MIIVLVVRRFWARVDSDFCTAVFVCVAVGFGLHFLVSLLVITGAVVCGGMCAVGVIFVVVISSYIFALLSVIVVVSLLLALLPVIAVLSVVSGVLVVFGGLSSLLLLSS